jgi:hypothetical protein
MPRSDEPTKPMTLGNMRSRGVRSLFATCLACGHKTKFNVDAWSDDVPVPSFGLHRRCTPCGNLGATAIPNWIERGNSLPGRGDEPDWRATPRTLAATARYDYD